MKKKNIAIIPLATAFATASVFADTYIMKGNGYAEDQYFYNANNWYYTTENVNVNPLWIERPALDTTNNTGTYKVDSTVNFTFSNATSFAPTVNDDVFYTFTKVNGTNVNQLSTTYLNSGFSAFNFAIRPEGSATMRLASTETESNFSINITGALTITGAWDVKIKIDDGDETNKYSIRAGSLYLTSANSVDFGDTNRAFDDITIADGTISTEGGANNTTTTRFYAKQVNFGGTYSMGLKHGQGKTTTTEMYFTDLVANSETAAFNVGGEIQLDQDVENSLQDIFILDFGNSGITDESNGIFNLVYAEEGYTGFDTENANLVYGFTIKNLNLTEGNYEFIMNDNMLQLAVGSAVPEPATVAGIAGLLALAFAAYRRRK